MNKDTQQILDAIAAWNFSSAKRPDAVQSVLLRHLAVIEDNNRLMSELEATVELLDNVSSTAKERIDDLRYVLNVILPYAAPSNMSGIDEAIEECQAALGNKKGDE